MRVYMRAYNRAGRNRYLLVEQKMRVEIIEKKLKESIEKAREREKRQRVSQYLEDPDTYLLLLLKRACRSYGITVDQYNALLKRQRQACAICRAPSLKKMNGRLYIDHCHKTGRVRGLLCDFCNKAIGFLKDDPKLFLRAHAYLKAC